MTNVSERRAILGGNASRFPCIQSFAKGDLSMHRSQQWLQFSIATLMFAVAAFAQKEHVPNRPGLSVEADQRRQAMSFSVSTLLTRNLHDVFGENDPARRRAAIDEIFTEDCVF
jgi:SnoaL-like domain